MGMFDHLLYDGKEYQTKDTPKQICDYYAIEGGELWSQEYDAEWVDDDTRHIIKGYLKQSNERWVRCSDFTGSINFYRGNVKQWIEYRAVIENGHVVNIEEIEDRWNK